jgi:glycosyltransferase involved in cell wall biosynthesis
VGVRVPPAAHIPNLASLYREFREIPLVSISDYQRLPLSWANWRATVHHGLPEKLYTFHENPGDYLAFIGRISPEKGVECAVEIARRCGLPLRIAAKVDRADREYYDKVVAPMLEENEVEFIGEINEVQKDGFLGNAKALLFPIDWPEPFGLVMIEALACGTPVIARLRGSVPEVLNEGETGFIVQDVDGAVRAVESLDRVDRRRCRQLFEERFTATRMARQYVGLYERQIEIHSPVLIS